MNNDWKKGLLTLLYKKGDKKDINNYRPIVILNSIYKIWTTVIANRLSPIMNLLTNEFQCAYKKIGQLKILSSSLRIRW